MCNFHELKTTTTHLPYAWEQKIIFMNKAPVPNLKQRLERIYIFVLSEPFSRFLSINALSHLFYCVFSSMLWSYPYRRFNFMQWALLDSNFLSSRECRSTIHRLESSVFHFLDWDLKFQNGWAIRFSELPADSGRAWRRMVAEPNYLFSSNSVPPK